MSVIGYSFEEAMASLRRSGRSAVMSIGTIAIAFATLGGFLLVSVNLQSVLNRWLEAAEMSVYLVDGVTDEERSALEQFVRAQPEVAAVEFVSRERALERFRVDFPELRDVADGVGENPFPSAIEVRLKGSLAGDASAEQLSRQIAGRAGVADVRYDRRWLARLIGIVASVRIGGALVAAILMLGAAFSGATAAQTDERLDRVLAMFPILQERAQGLAGAMSGGQQQMLAIGRALMGSPQLLLLDEPSLGLAPLIVSQVFSTLVRLNSEGLTILLIEQNAKQALDVTSRAYVLEQGRIVREGESRALANDPEIAAHYLGQDTNSA